LFAFAKRKAILFLFQVEITLSELRYFYFIMI